MPRYAITTFGCQMNVHDSERMHEVLRGAGYSEGEGPADADVVRVATYDEAVALVSENPYGNGTAIFTNDGGAARRFVSEVEAGMASGKPSNLQLPGETGKNADGSWQSAWLWGDRRIARRAERHLCCCGPCRKCRQR